MKTFIKLIITIIAILMIVVISPFVFLLLLFGFEDRPEDSYKHFL